VRYFIYVVFSRSCIINDPLLNSIYEKDEIAAVREIINNPVLLPRDCDSIALAINKKINYDWCAMYI